MKTKRELELEMDLYTTRNQLIQAHYEIMMRDKAINDDLIKRASSELKDLIKREESEN